MRFKRCCNIDPTKIRFELYDVRRKNAYQLCFRHVYDVLNISERVRDRSGLFAILWDNSRDFTGVLADSGNIPIVFDPVVVLPRLATMNHELVFALRFQYRINDEDEAQIQVDPEPVTQSSPNTTRGVALPVDHDARSDERVDLKRVGCVSLVLAVGLLLMLIVCTSSNGYDCAREGNKIYGVESGTADVLEFMRRCDY